ncbi:MAG: ThiF family adenylyltransferase [Rhizobiales bacterium]|nr:ThiF family adenylyltransferase [Hyphomicrobiales bacterium]
MTTTLVLPGQIADDIDRAARGSDETAGVLIARVVEAPNGDVRLLARKMMWVTSDAYVVRESDRLSIASHGYVPALGEAERLQAAALWFHTHPGLDGIPLPSRCDLRVDREIADLFRLRTENPYYGTLIASPRGGDIAFSGTLQPEDKPPIPIERLWRVGDALRLSRGFDSSSAAISPIFDRNVRAFGSAIQGALGDLKIGIVGSGGTGSSVAEQLVRLGVRHLTLIDVDTLTESNVTRVYGSTPGDVGRAKVDVLREHLSGIAPDLECRAIAAMVTLERTARELIGCDVIFGCTDDNAGRLVLSRFATYLIAPVIDLGVLLSSDDGGRLVGIDGRVTVLTPGAACLVCRDRIDLARAASELMTPEERNRLANEGYAPALGGVEPAVVAFTTAIAAAAVNELLERLIGYGPQPRPNEVLLRWHEREISTNVMSPRPGHYCHPANEKLGRGAGAPFLDQVWPTP